MRAPVRERRLFLGLDVGTQGTKGLVLDADAGTVVARASRSYELIAGLPPGAPGPSTGAGGPAARPTGSVSAPGFADADVSAAPLRAGGAGSGPGRPVGEVAALLDSATAQRAGTAPRSIRCGDIVYEGERVVTEPDARVGILSDDAYVQVDSDSTLLLGLTPDEALDLELLEGQVRVVDSRERGSRGRLRVGNAEAELIGNDVEAYLLGGPGNGGYLCSRDGALAVSQNGSALVGAPGGCVIASAVQTERQAPPFRWGGVCE